jgi:hypothetical protein
MNIISSIILVVAALSSFHFSCALNPIEIKGYKFFDSVTGEPFLIRGIDYYPRPNAGIYNFNSVDFYTEDFRHVWERDLQYLQELGVNAIRLYSVDPDQNHDAFMCTMDRAGIYVIVALATDCPTCAVTRDEAPLCYPNQLKMRGQAVILEFAKYSNTLAFSAGNEVNHFAPSGHPEWNGPCQKKFLRDMREYIDSCPSLRNVPIGLVSADSDRDENAIYYNCQGDSDDQYENAEWFGLNSYLFCNHNVTGYLEAAGFVALQKSFHGYNYSIPVVLTEFGCLSETFETIDGYEAQRDFRQAQWLLTEPTLLDQFAGGFAFEYSIEYENAKDASPYPFKTFGAQNYGVGYFEPEDCDEDYIYCTYKPLPAFEHLQTAYKQNLTSSNSTNRNSFDIPESRQGRAVCPEQFKPLSYYSWKSDKIQNLACPVRDEDSKLSCPADLDELRGRYGQRSKYHHTSHFPYGGSIMLASISIVALGVAYCMMQQRVESEMSIVRMSISRGFYTLKPDNDGDTSDESTGLLSMQDLAGAEGCSKTPYSAIESESSFEDP